MKRLCSTLVLSAVLVTAPQLTFADDDDGNRVRGSTTGYFTQFDFLNDVDGNLLFNVNIEGTFALRVGRIERSGTFKYPHILQVPPGGEGLGTIAGVGFWTFENGLTCIGDLGGPIGPNGGHYSGRLRCSDGSTLKLSIRDEEVVPGVQVISKVRGRLFYETDDD